jgi:WD40 repeat protein
MASETSPKDETLAKRAPEEAEGSSDGDDPGRDRSHVTSWLKDIARLPVVVMPSALGRTLGRYRVIGELGRGGMGVVYDAIDTHLQRSVALKCLPAHLVGDASRRRRFLSEALVTAGLEHPGIVPVHDAGETADGELYYAMKKVSGRPLSALIEEAADLAGRLALLPHVLATADAVAYAHDAQVVHRDIKPNNILVGAFGETIVVDWGLAKRLGPEPAGASGGADEPPPLPLSPQEETRAGDVLGTPGYMSPEQAAGSRVDARSDVYALGALLYHVVTGQSPARSPSARSLATVADAGPDLAAIVTKAMAQSPEQRYATARELADELRRFQSGQLVGAYRYSLPSLVRRWLRRHRGLVSGVASLAILLAVFGVVSVGRIAHERDTASAERRKAEAARAQAVERQNALVLLQARAQLGRDPTAALAWLKKFPHNTRDWPEEERIAYDAWSRGVARYLYSEATPFTAVAVSNDAAVVAASHADFISIWETANGDRRELRADDGLGIGTALGLSPDGRFLFSSDGAGAIRLWDLQRNTSQTFSGRADQFRFGDALALSLFDGQSPHLFALDTPREVPLPNDVRSADFIDGGARVALARARALVLFDPKTGGSLDAAPLDERVGSVAASVNGRRVVAGAVRDLLVLDRASGRWRTIPGAGDVARRVAVSPDGRWAASCGMGSLGAWLFDLDALSATVVSPVEGCGSAYGFSPDGTKLLTRGVRNVVTVWNVATKQRGLLAGQEDAIQDAAFSANGQWFVSASSDGTVRVLPADDGILATMRDVVAGSKIVAGGKMLVRRNADGAMLLRDLRGSEERIAPQRTSFAPDDVGSLSADARRAAFIDRGGRLFVVDVGRSPDGSGRTTDVGRSPDGSGRTTDVGRSPDGSGRTTDVASGSERAFGPYPEEGEVIVDALSRDGLRLAFTTASGVVHIADTSRGTERVIGRHEGKVYGIGFSEDGTALATGGQDQVLRVWNVETGELERAFVGHTARIWDVGFSHDGRRIVSASADGTVRVWERLTGESRTLRGHLGPVTSASMAPDGAHAVSTGVDGTLRLWTLATGEGVILRRGGRLWFAQYSADTTRISVSSDAGVLVFDPMIPKPTLAGFDRWLEATTTARVDDENHIVGGP